MVASWMCKLREIASLFRPSLHFRVGSRGDSGSRPLGFGMKSYALPSEAALMQEHGLARETVRKAARVLAGEGLVTVVQGPGVYVTKRTER